MIRLLKLISFTICTLALYGCAFGGGTIGTGISGLSATPGVGVRQSMLQFVAKGFVKFEGQPVSGGQLSALTSNGVETVTIRNNGQFELLITKLPGESVIFEIELRDQLYQLETELSPAGASQVEIDFLINNTGDVRMTTKRN